MFLPRRPAAPTRSATAPTIFAGGRPVQPVWPAPVAHGSVAHRRGQDAQPTPTRSPLTSRTWLYEE